MMSLDALRAGSISMMRRAADALDRFIEARADLILQKLGTALTGVKQTVFDSSKAVSQA